MNKTDSAKTLLLFTVLCAIAGAILRAAFLNGGNAVYLIAASAVVTVLILCRCLKLKTVSYYGDLFREFMPSMIAQLFGALLLLAGGLLCFTQELTVMQKILAALAIVSAVFIAIGALNVQTGKDQKTVFYAVVTLYFVIKLFYDFRHWMLDPAVLDYCFRLFASISFMLCAYHLTEATVTDAKRRRIALFSLCGVFFGATSLTDLTGSDFLFCAGGVLWALGTAWQVTDRKTDSREDKTI